MNQFALAMEGLRELKRFTQKEMAELIGLTVHEYNNRIKGRRNFVMKNLQEAADKTNTSLLVAFIDNKQLYFKEKSNKTKKQHD